MSAPPLSIHGIGSPHGDDRFGWNVVHRLNELLMEPRLSANALRRDSRSLSLHTPASPVDMLDHLTQEGRLVICDACRGLSQPGESRSFNWPSCEIEELAGSGSHDFSLVDTLKLAERLGRLPASVTIWVTERSPQDMNCSLIDDSLSPPVAAAVERVAQHLLEEYIDA